MTEQGRGKYQSDAHCAWGLWSCCSEAPRLLGSCQLIKAKSLPIPAGIPHQTARGAFYPKQNAASCHSGGSAPSPARTAKFNTAEWKSIPCRGAVAQTRDVWGGREQWKGHQENGILKDTACPRQEHAKARSQMMPASQLMSRFSLWPCANSDVSQLRPNILYLSFPPITVKVTASVVKLGSCVQILSRGYRPQQKKKHWLPPS